MNDKLIIKCPKCGYQYLPSEVFIPTSFLGSAHGVIRNAAGKIVCFTGAEPDLNETFACDCCGTNFSIDTILSFKTSVIEEDVDFH